MTYSQKPADKPHRWVLDEPVIPADLPILYEDQAIIAVDKPHFLPTMPRGMWYKSTAVMTMRERTGNDSLIPAHRLDRMTAGVLILVKEPQYRKMYQMLFQSRQVHKTYQCLAPIRPASRPRLGLVGHVWSRKGEDNNLSVDVTDLSFPLLRSSHITKKRGILQAYEEAEAINAVSLITISSHQSSHVLNKGLRAYTLHPLTGKTHQLRVHMTSLGLPIDGDNWYPQVEERAYDDFSRPLQLIAREISFTDPVTGQERIIRSNRPFII